MSAINRVSRASIAATALSTAVLVGAPGAAPAHTLPAADEIRQVPRVQRIEPALTATPRADCGPGSRPETGIQGRVPRADHESGRAAAGYTCNTELVGSYRKPNPQGTVGGFKVERYVDAAGRDCAYYDTTLLAPTSLIDVEAGVNVLDMTNPSKPILTDKLVTPAMLSPHETLLVNQKRGLLVAVLGNPTTYPGLVDIYDISKDCRQPVLRSSTPTGILGHESGMSPDGRTLYSGSPASETLVAIDISDPAAPAPLWVGPYDSHGLSLSNDGNRAYVAGTGSGLIILDTSEVQARIPNPQVREIARLTWDSMSIPQNAIPVTIDGDPYVIEIDEFGAQDAVGAGRIIDIADEAKPRVVSNLRLDVHQPENFEAQAGDPQAGVPLQGYAGHYCNVPRRIDPRIVACSMILSGLRVFDIRDPLNPREIAYYNAPIGERLTPGFEASNWAMSSPSFVPERGEIWYSDGFQGFFAVKLTNGVWPFSSGPGAGGRCSNRIEGTEAADKLRGTNGSDRILGKQGSDRLSGRGGDDCLLGKGGPDTIAGNGGSDDVRGGSGKDKIATHAGRDEIRGGRGKDKIKAGGGGDKIRAARGGRDRIDCGPGEDLAFINERKDRTRRCETVRAR